MNARKAATTAFIYMVKFKRKVGIVDLHHLQGGAPADHAHGVHGVQHGVQGGQSEGGYQKYYGVRLL